MSNTNQAKQQAVRAYRVQRSTVHGNGVFAQRDIPVSECIIEYCGQVIPWEIAIERAEERGGPVNHTFFFSLADGNVIDGGVGGNASRFINHSCEPNCEAYEEDGRVFIYAIQEIACGDELSYSYPLIYDGRRTAAVKRAFACRCGAPSCSGTMLAPKARAKAKPKAKSEGEIEAAATAEANAEPEA